MQTDRHVLTVAVVAVGGAAGTAARYGIGRVWPQPAHQFPWATFVVNVSGCFALAMLMVLVVEALPSSRYVRPLLGVGVLGSYTTVSTYALETRDLLDAGRQQLAALYLTTSLVGCLLAVWLGIIVARLALRAGTRLAGRRRNRPAGRTTSPRRSR